MAKENEMIVITGDEAEEQRLATLNSVNFPHEQWSKVIHICKTINEDEKLEPIDAFNKYKQFFKFEDMTVGAFRIFINVIHNYINDYIGLTVDTSVYAPEWLDKKVQSDFCEYILLSPFYLHCLKYQTYTVGDIKTDLETAWQLLSKYDNSFGDFS